MVVVMLAQASLAVTTTRRGPSRCRPHRGERMVESTRAGEHAREHARGRARARARACGVSACRPRARPFSVSLYIHTTPHHTPHHTTPHHITSHHLVLLPAPGAADGVKGTWRCGQCVCVCVGVGVGVHVLCCGVGVGVGVVARCGWCGLTAHTRSVCHSARAHARKSTRACGADAFNDAFSHTLQPGCLALVVTVQSPTNGRPRAAGCEMCFARPAARVPFCGTVCVCVCVR